MLLLGRADPRLPAEELLVPDPPSRSAERIRFRELIAQIGQERIVLLSTHIVSDLEHIADRLIIMKDGQLLWKGKWNAEEGDLEAFYIAKVGAKDSVKRG